MNDSTSPKMVAGFWIRVASDILDAIFLGIFGLCISLPFKSFFYKIGESGVWIGLIVTFFYAGILQSAIGEGQSLAKRMLKIQVVKMNGEYISLPMSFLRYSVIAMIFYNGWIALAIFSLVPALNNPTFQAIYGTGVFFLIAGTMLMVPLHPLKRGIHDLISGSAVVYKGTFDTERISSLNNPSKAMKAYAIPGIVGIAFLILAFTLGKRAMASPMMKELLQAQQQITSDTTLTNVSVREFWFKSFGKEQRSTKTLIVNGFMQKERYDNRETQDSEAQKAARILINALGDARAREFDKINVVIRTGFNIGICNINLNNGHLFGPDGSPINEQSKAAAPNAGTEPSANTVTQNGTPQQNR